MVIIKTEVIPDTCSLMIFISRRNFNKHWRKTHVLSDYWKRKGWPTQVMKIDNYLIGERVTSEEEIKLKQNLS